MRSRKLVSSRLKAVVCEFAILPEMFSSANDCARSPVTAVVRAPKIPMTCLRPIEAALTRARSGEASQGACHRLFVGGSIAYRGSVLQTTGAKLPGAAGFAGLRRPARSIRRELERHAVHTITQAGWRRPVL